MSSPAPWPANEAERLQRLRSLQALHTEAEPLFDALTQAAALVVGTPIALVSLIDAEHQWFKSNLGLDGTPQTPREMAFCAWTILGDDLFVVPDALADPRFADNPLVTGSPDIRFYAGAPIVLSDGLRMGSLCVIDVRPRQLSQTQADVLRQLARAASQAFEQRARALQRDAEERRAGEAEKLLDEQQRRLAGVLHAIHAGTWEWNVQTGDLLVDESWMAIFGYAPEDAGVIVAAPLHKLLPSMSGDESPLEMKATHPDDRQHVSGRLAEYLDGRRKLFETESRMRHRDGHWVWVQTRGRVRTRNSDGSPLWMDGTLVDISERKAIEQRLQQSEALLDRSGRMAGVGGWQVDLESGEIQWSDQTCIIHDLPPGHRPDMPEALGYYAPQGREAMEQAVQRSIADGTPWDIELPMVTAKGRAIWARSVGAAEFEQGKPRRLIGAFQDITFRKRAVAALELSERRFRRLFEESLGLIWTHDLQGTILSANPAAAHALGYALADLMGRPLLDLMQPELHAHFALYMDAISKDRKASGLIRLTARDGSQRIWQYHNTMDDEGSEPFVLGHAQDITGRMNQERQLREWSVRDALTGCYNRRYLAEVSAAIADGDVWGCIAVDLDRFKQVNDTYGHQRGDEVLVAMAAFLTRHARSGDLVIRVGGDEFLMLLGQADEAQTQSIIERIEADQAQAPIGFTLGHAIRHAGASLDTALAAADQSLYAVRAQRRGAAM